MDWYIDFVEMIVFLLSLVVLYQFLFNSLFWFVDDGREIQKVEVINNGVSK